MSELSNFVREVLSVLDIIGLAKDGATQYVEKEIGAVAAQQALNAMGINLNISDGTTKKDISEAIDRDLLGSIGFTNIFDADAVRADARRVALNSASDAFGYERGLSVDGLKRAIVSELAAEIRGQINAKSGEYFEAAPDSGLATSIINREKKDSREIKNFSRSGEKNRERQARYRASHKRVWI